MAKYEKYSGPQIKPRPWDIHPVWRGIGCLLMVLIPVISYIAADLLVAANANQRWLTLPAELLQAVGVPAIGKVPHLYANLIVTVILSLIGFGLLTIVTSLLYSVTGPPRYGPLDSPPFPPKRSRW